MCQTHEWRCRGDVSVCLCCGATVDEPVGEPPKKKRLVAKAWQRERRKMLQRLGR